MENLSEREIIAERIKDLAELLAAQKITPEEYENEIRKLKKTEEKLEKYLSEQEHQKLKTKQKERTLADIVVKPRFSITDFFKGVYYRALEQLNKKKEQKQIDLLNRALKEKNRYVQEIKEAGKIYMNQKMTKEQFKYFVRKRQNKIRELDKTIEFYCKEKEFNKMFEDIRKAWKSK